METCPTAITRPFDSSQQHVKKSILHLVLKLFTIGASLGVILQTLLASESWNHALSPQQQLEVQLTSLSQKQQLVAGIVSENSS